MYFPPGGVRYGITFHNTDDTESREVFCLKVNTNDKFIYASFIIGTGFTYALKKVLLGASLNCVLYFQKTMNGEYWFDNMFSSSPTYAYYTLSGNYIALQFAISFLKKKDSRN